MNERDIDDCRQSLTRITRDYPAVKASGWAKPVRGQQPGSRGSHANPTEAIVVDGREKRHADGTVTWVPGFLEQCRSSTREADRQVRIAKNALYAASRSLERALKAEPKHEFRSPPPTPDDPEDPAGGWRVTRAEFDERLMMQARRTVPTDAVHRGLLNRDKETAIVMCDCSRAFKATGDAKPAVDAWVEHVIAVTGLPARMVDYGEGS